jgi:hypothetical protein
LAELLSNNKISEKLPAFFRAVQEQEAEGRRGPGVVEAVSEKSI